MTTRLWMVSLLALAGCGGGEPAAEDTAESTAGDETTTAAADPDEVPSPPTAWEEMDDDAKRQWMVAEVLPRMRDRFQAHDAEEFAGFGCGTCHGPNAREEGFHMPNVALPALPVTGSPEQQQMVNQYEDDCRFMFSTVLPTMQTLLGAPDFNEDTGEGFSCFSCHPREGDEGATLISLETPGGEEDGDDEE